jgi:hypothetical protein
MGQIIFLNSSYQKLYPKQGFQKKIAVLKNWVIGYNF